MDDRNKTAKRNYHVPNLDRALQIVETLSTFPRGLNRNEIAATTGCSVNMVYRIMMTFVDAGWAYRDENTGAYRLSRRLMDFAVAGSDEYSLASVAWPEMCALRDETNLTVQLGIITSDDRGLIIETAESRNPIRYVEEKGVWTADLNTGAGWKSMMAFMPEAERERLLSALPFNKRTENTITSREEFEKALVGVRDCGYAVDRAEGREGLHCVAAPVFDRTGRPVGTISISAPADQLPTKDFKSRAPSVMAAASAVSAKLGWSHNHLTRRKAQ